MNPLPRVQSQTQQSGKFKATGPTPFGQDSKISARFIEVGEKYFPPMRHLVHLATNLNLAVWLDRLRVL